MSDLFGATSTPLNANRGTTTGCRAFVRDLLQPNAYTSSAIPSTTPVDESTVDENSVSLSFIDAAILASPSIMFNRPPFDAIPERALHKQSIDCELYNVQSKLNEVQHMIGESIRLGNTGTYMYGELIFEELILQELVQSLR